MKWYIVLFTALLVVPFVHSADEAIPGLDAGNRFLAAEVSRSMLDAKTEMLQEIKDYQDQNFAIFDSRMQQFMKDTKYQIVLGAIGAAMVANAIIALFLFKVTKNYSYEKFLEGKLDAFKEVNAHHVIIPGIQNMQAPVWHEQVPNETLGMMYGQAQASNMSQMNAWQTQPAYSGSWHAPVDVEPDYNRTPGSYYKADKNDPMDSPGWNPGG